MNAAICRESNNLISTNKHHNYNIYKPSRHITKSYLTAIIISIAAMIIILLSCFMIVNAGVNSSVKQYKYYTSITIQKGDTLWNLANKYTNNSDSVNTYINNLKQINHLANDNITEGQNLIIYYYSADYK